VSRFEPRKNQVGLLKAFVEGEFYNKYDLFFIGKRSLPCTEFDIFMAGLNSNIKRSIHLLEGISNEELKNFIFFSSVFVYPSYAEGFGIPPLEAAAMRKTVICSNATAMMDFTFFSEYHFYPSADNLLFALQKADKEEPNLERLSAISNKIATQYSWDTAADKMLQVYNLSLT